ncbi:MAG: hypothetical protein KIT02_00820 [Devosia sp.]|uniref:hypothetical protein n=1 Tax=Devosia sp. TaxID=1871048 RepID=UPI0024C96E55|nr:hypothetical protein [Devosia sp.]UYN99818.1 MAG: hypothetical protein KIT02_00820 [Devosia sp.]
MTVINAVAGGGEGSQITRVEFICETGEGRILSGLNYSGPNLTGASSAMREETPFERRQFDERTAIKLAIDFGRDSDAICQRE